MLGEQRSNLKPYIGLPDYCECVGFVLIFFFKELFILDFIYETLQIYQSFYSTFKEQMLAYKMLYYCPWQYSAWFP